MFFSADLFLAAVKMRKNEFVTGASGMILQNHRLLPVCVFSVEIAALGGLKRVTGRIFKISQQFAKEQAKTFSLIFSSTKKQ
jgi:hypothetical protein